MSLSHETYSLATAIIQKCSSTTSLRKARQVHGLILTFPTFNQPTAFLHNNLISLYERCGSIGDCQKVFDKMPQRNLVSFNAIISACRRNPHQAFRSFLILSEMANEGFRPNGSTFSSLIQASSSLKDRCSGFTLHSQVFRFGFSNDIRVQTSLIGMYSNCEDLDSANRVFSHMVCKDAMAWNSLIYGNMKNNRIRQGLQLLCSMVRTGSMPTSFTYSIVLSACSRLEDFSIGQIIHAKVIISDSQADTALQNALVNMYCSSGNTETAFYIFNKMKKPNLVSWNTMIAGYSENELGEKAMDMFVQLSRMSSIKADEFTFAAIISATGDFPSSFYGRPLHAQVEKAGLEGHVFVGSTLISMYFNNGEIDSAQKFFNLMPEKDAILWTEMITGHSRLGDGENAIKHFYMMHEKGHKVDGFALSSALSSCADLATMRQGEIIHSQVVKTGYGADMCVCGSLIDMYAKNGNLWNAQLVFSMVAYPGLKCWNSMLGGYSHHGKVDEALKTFDEILKQGLVPDQVTFVSLLSACSHAGLVDTGKFLWNYMKENGLQPVPKHYSCMITLLSRAGSLQEAREMIQESPFRKDCPKLWRILLSSCVIHKNLVIGVHAAEKILEMDAEDSTTYILLSNLYGAAGKWDAVAEMRRKIGELTLEKDPGLSWIEIMNEINFFSSDDQSHPWIAETHVELQRLVGNMTTWEMLEI